MMGDQNFEEIVELHLPARLFRRSVGIAFDFGTVTFAVYFFAMGEDQGPLLECIGRFTATSLKLLSQ